MVEAFFAEPQLSAGGWEKAADAQARVADAVETALVQTPEGTVAFVAHGSVGALLLCRLKGVAITQSELQPDPPLASDGHGGFYFAFERESRRLLHGWRAIDDL